MYIKVVNGEPKKYTAEDILKENPNAVIYRNTKKPAEDLLLNYGFYPFITTDRPNEYPIVYEGKPILGDDGKWYQSWIGRDYNQEERKIIFVTKNELKLRADICKKCDLYNKMIKTCDECGCFMPIKRKFRRFYCPLNKW